MRDSQAEVHWTAPLDEVWQRSCNTNLRAVARRFSSRTLSANLVRGCLCHSLTSLSSFLRHPRPFGSVSSLYTSCFCQL